MKLLCELTDKNVLGIDGWAFSEPRLTARAILKNSDGLFAVMYAEKFDFHSLPGGGIEKNEDKITALKREILEETGCECDAITELGYVYENRAHCNYAQISYYYLVSTGRQSQTTDFTDDEMNNRTILKWCTFEEVVKLIKDAKYSTNQQKFLQARDVAALKEYEKLCI